MAWRSRFMGRSSSLESRDGTDPEAGIEKDGLCRWDVDGRWDDDDDPGPDVGEGGYEFQSNMEEAANRDSSTV